MKNLFLLVALFFSSVALAALDEGSPFTNVEFQEDNILVEFEGTSYYLISIDAVPTADIVSACVATYQDDCETMFAENFTETLATLALPGTDWDQEGALAEVDLELYFFRTHQVSFFEDAPVTPENRQQLLTNRAKGQE